MLTLGCAEPVTAPADSNVTVRDNEEDVLDDSDNDNSHLGYQPDMVVFHSVTIVNNGNEIGCFDEGDDTPYCGVYKIFLTVWDDWGGIADQGSCEIIHRVSPDFLVDNGNAADLLDNGALAAWEMDAALSYVGVSPMCDYIQEGNPQHSVLERFKAENPVWGITIPSEDMLAEYKESYNIADESWETDYLPYLGAFTNKIGSTIRVPNTSVPFMVDENNAPLSNEDGTLITVEMSDVELTDAYYRSPPYYVYSLDRFVVSPEDTEAEE